MSVRVNTVSIGASSTSASAYSATIPTGTGIIAGDVLVVNAVSNGTHVLNGITCQDSVNLTNFTQIKEQQLGGSSAYYQQTFYYVAAANIPDGSLVTLTPYAAATDTCFSVDIYRYALGTITNAVVSQANTASTSQAAPALAAAPAIGNLVLTFDAAAGTGALTPGAAFTAGSTQAGTASATATAFLSASGSSTYASTWTDAGSVVSATQTVALQNAGVGTPYTVGSTAQAAGSSSTVVNVTTSTNSGDALFLLAGLGAGSTVTPAASTPVSDSKTHTWTQIGSFVATNGMACYIYQSLHATTTLVGGTDTVTINWTGTSYAKFAEVIACAGVNQTTALDQTATASASTGAPAATTANPLANNNELILSVITAGSASQGITWASPMTAMDAGLHVSGGVYMSVGTQAVSGSTAPVTAGATLGATAVWAELMVTLLPDPPTGAAATITITNSSPLPAGQVGVAYSDQLAASGGSPPYTWSVTAGALPGGLQLEAGTSSGGTGDFTYVGVNTGPQGAPTLAQFQTCYTAFGPMGCYKFFFTALPSSWSGTLMDQITGYKAAVFCYISWSTVMSASAISAFIATIPHSIAAVGFTFDSEPENGGYSSGTDFVNKFVDQATKIKAAQATTPVKLFMMTASFTNWYQTGGNNSYIPPASSVDVYGMDFYDRATHSAGPDMSSTVSWKTWLGYVKNFGKPIALTEFGISGYSTDSAQNTRLQADLAYLKGAFGPGGSVSQSPLFVWLYWNTGGTAYGGTNINEFQGPLTRGTWQGIEKLATNQPGTATSGSSGTGGLLWGTPSTAVGSPFSFTVRATDSAAATGSKAFTLSVSGSSTLAVSTASLDGATLGAAYSNTLLATGGTSPYTWSVSVGSLPAGLSLAASTGVISGTPTTPGTSSFTVKVTDNVAATATAALSITVSAGVTITTTSPLPAGTVGTTYTTVLAAAGGTSPYTWAVTSGTLPDGLAIDPDGSLTGTAGQISGTPTTAGVSTFTATATDSAGGTPGTASAVFTLAVAASSAITAPGRRKFGGSNADWTFAYGGFSPDSLLRSPGATVTFWSALVGGTQYTDLQNTGFSPITSVTTDSNGEMPEFYGPSGIWRMAADAGGGTRRWIVAQDFGDWLNLVYGSLVRLGG